MPTIYQRTLPTAFFLVLFCTHYSLLADELNVDSGEQSTLEWLKNKRNDWGKLVGDTGKRLDGFFAKDDSLEQTNDSFIKIGLRGQQRSGESSTLKPQFKFRLDLPSLKERLKLVIESSPEESKTLEQTKLSQEQSNEEKVTDSAIGAIELIAKPSRKWNGSTSIGLDFKLPADPFWRAKGSFQMDLSTDWDLSLRENIYYFHESGWGESTQFVVQYKQDSYVFRTTSEAKYSHSSRTMSFAQIFSVLNELSTKHALNNQIGVLAKNKPLRETTSYFIKTTYRHRLYSSWLFYEITPELKFPRNDNFNLQPSLTVRIELVFSSQE